MKNSLFSVISLACLFSFINISYSQERTFTGKVTTLEKIAIVNAEVEVLSSKVTVLTDSTGKFEVSCLNKDKIKITAKGFKSQKVKISENTKDVVIDLTFNPTEKNIEQAIGYGYIKDEDRSYAITTAKNTGKNDFMIYTNMIDVIVNSSPSVTFNGAGFIIRGSGSLLGSSYAMIIIDGNQVNLNQLKMISPMDVDSVDILKGSATSIYGSRGANGVIVVRLKTGQGIK